MIGNYAVIGAGFGDEGKGLITDYLTRRLTQRWVKPVVIRQNGGAQAGHTVVSPEGTRHVFSHIGAGTLAGASTHLSSSFMVNFHRLEDEMVQLKSYGKNPELTCSPSSKVTTIFDIMINQALETSRGNARAGSCGLGINETLKRSEHDQFRIDVVECIDFYTVSFKLFVIKQKWVPARLEELGIKSMELLERFDAIDVMTLAHFYVSMARHHLELEPKSATTYVVEGAQGLRIDKDYGVFPHVTPTSVGLPATVRAIKEVGQDQVSPVYVTRAYVTRHGAGPLELEGLDITDKVLVDATNAPNEFQGSLRYAPLDLLRLKQFIQMDLASGLNLARELGVTVAEPVIALTCLDQLGTYVNISLDGENLIKVKPHELKPRIEQQVGMKVKFVSHGETSKTVEMEN